MLNYISLDTLKADPTLKQEISSRTGKTPRELQGHQQDSTRQRDKTGRPPDDRTADTSGQERQAATVKGQLRTRDLPKPFTKFIDQPFDYM